MNEQIVALSVDKIQTFLTEVIDSHVQEKQTEDGTLRKIIDSSYQISKGFFESIKSIFPDSDKEVLLECSGVYIFRCTLSKLELEKRLNSLFTDYYRESQGQKLIRWVHFPSGVMNDIDAIKKAKKCLKQSKCWNKTLEKNQGLLFSFCLVQKEEDKKYNNNINLKNFPMFARDINALHRKEDVNEEDKKRFRIAILKADLDEMAETFNKIKEYKIYKNISQILNEEVSLIGLHGVAVSCTPKGKTRWLFPLYIAGDDIFFAVAVEDLIYGINVCREMMKTINQKIKESGSTISFGMSVGVDITFNKQPIRYYMDMVETQLKYAKSKEVPKAIRTFFIMKISIGNLTFFDINYEQMKNQSKLMKCKKNGKARCQCENCKKRAEINQQLQNVPIWNYFLSDVRLLNYIRNSKSECSELLGRPNFFYTLLEDITTGEIQCTKIKYINHILYHLIPSHFEDSNQNVRKMELLLNTNLIKQLYQKDGKGAKIVLNIDTKQRFETYLRLMLLFCDVRFEISAKEEDKRYEKQKKEVYRYLFAQPREYLYEHCLKEINEELTGVFLKKVKAKNKVGYARLILEASMFFRLRKVESISIEKAAKMIELRNPSTKDEKQTIQDLNEKPRKEEKLFNHLYFDKKKFCSIAKDINNWSPDFIDSLMLFYQYNEMVIKFKQTEIQIKEKELSH